MQFKPSIKIKKCIDTELNSLKAANKQVLRYQEGEMAHTHTDTHTHTHTHIYTYIYIYIYITSECNKTCIYFTNKASICCIDTEVIYIHT
jgi:hypothetical protein